LWLLLTATLFIYSIFSIQAQNTEGTDFWVTFGKMQHTTFYNVEIQIRVVSGNKPTKGSIYFTSLGNSQPFNLGAFETYNYILTSEQKEAALNSITGKTNFSLYISSNDPVSVYALRLNLSFPCRGIDVTNILPVPSLGTEYYQISYTTISSSSNPDAYAVVATENNTQLFHNGVPISEGILNKGEVYYRTSISDMTGAQITSNKPVAFFSCATYSYVPTYWAMGGPSLLMQQLAPVKTWGRNFFVPVSNAPSDIVRIVASQNGTNINQTGGTIRTGVPGAQINLTGLLQGQFVELEVPISCHIQSNNPVGVCSYLSAIGTLMTGAQCWIPSKEQTYPHALVAPFISNFFLGINEHFALVATPFHTKNDTRVSIGGAPPVPLTAGSGWIDNMDANMSYYVYPLTHTTASYYFTNQKGLFILGCATGNCGNSQESYYYLAGSAMRELDAAFYANDIHFQDLKENPICESLITFRAEIEGLHPTATERIKWYVDGVHQPAGFNQETWSRNFSVGEYKIRMWVRYENNDTVNKIGTLKICSLGAAFFANEVHNEALPDTTFCNKTVHFLAETGALSTEPEHIRWYIDYNNGNGYVEELSVLDLTQWSKDFANGTYPVKMWVRFENGNDATITSTLKIRALCIKIKNVRY